MPRIHSIVLTTVSLLALMGCASMSNREPIEQDSAFQVARDAHLAYRQGDCDRVNQITNEADLERWPATEARASLRLLEAFCQELGGDPKAAREIYRDLVAQAPLSFAAMDARDRLRMLRLLERDPDHATWIESARARARNPQTDLSPLNRVPAEFPPLALDSEVGGFAVVEFGVTPRGDTDAPVVVDSDPPLLFDGVATRAVREWRYEKRPEQTRSQRQVIRLIFRPEDGANAEATPYDSAPPTP